MRKGMTLVLLAAFTGCGQSAGDSGDASAELACRHFRNVAADYSDGLLTVGELRTKLREVHDDARLSELAGLASSSQAMVSELTAERMGDAFDDAVRSFGVACRSIDL